MAERIAFENISCETAQLDTPYNVQVLVDGGSYNKWTGYAENGYSNIVLLQDTLTGTGLTATATYERVLKNNKFFRFYTITISGTPATTGEFRCTLRASIKNTSYYHDTYIYVTVGAGNPPVITTETLPDAEAGTAYSATLEATGTTPITWSVTAGELPPGLSLDASTGVISGTPA